MIALSSECVLALFMEGPGLSRENRKQAKRKHSLTFMLHCCVSPLSIFLPTQVHLRLDTSLEQDKLSVQTYISRNLGLGECVALGVGCFGGLGGLAVE